MGRPFPPIVFRAWVDRKRSNAFYAVMVFRTKADMLAQYRIFLRAAGCPVKDIQKTDAACVSWSEATCLHPKQYGVVLVTLDVVGAGLVSHEMTHAALYWVCRTHCNAPRFTFDSARDERLAWVQGWLVTQFWRWWWRLEKRGAWARMKNGGVPVVNPCD